MADLITRARALRNLNGLSPSPAEETTLDGLIAAVSAAIENHCRRRFAVETFDECCDGAGRRELLLRHYPVVSVERVLGAPEPALRVVNRSGSIQRAWVRVDGAGLVLTRVASGATVENALRFTDHATLGALASAVVGVGSGWSAELVRPEDADFAASDLIPSQGAFYAKDSPAELRLHRRPLADFDLDADRGILYRGWRFEEGGDVDGPVWSGGPRFWRVVYSAGFATVPEDVQEACASWVASLFWLTKRDPGLAHESVSGLVARGTRDDLSAPIFRLLRPYRNLRI